MLERKRPYDSSIPPGMGSNPASPFPEDAIERHPLWLLKMTQKGCDELPCDAVNGFVIRAESEEEARRMAGEGAGMEEWSWGAGDCVDYGPSFWKDPELTSCVKLESVGRKGIVLKSYVSG
jgi:hypothetical protein